MTAYNLTLADAIYILGPVSDDGQALTADTIADWHGKTSAMNWEDYAPAGTDTETDEGQEIGDDIKIAAERVLDDAAGR